MSNAIVLLSGGMDSVAALHWALENYDDVRALHFMYGQPLATLDAERTYSHLVADKRGVPWADIHLGDAVRGFMATILPAKPGFQSPGVSNANLPARNAIMLPVAANHGARLWPGGSFDLVIGANKDDEAGFPDCRISFLESAALYLRTALEGVATVAIRAPWIEQHKSCVLWWCLRRPDALADVRDSTSCYSGTRCGACDACTLRASAFAACGETDGTWTPKLCGGDPSRSAGA